MMEDRQHQQGIILNQQKQVESYQVDQSFEGQSVHEAYLVQT